MCEAGVENESSHSASVNSFQSKLYAFQVLMDAYKYLSVGLHHWSNLVCPTCHLTLNEARTTNDDRKCQGGITLNGSWHRHERCGSNKCGKHTSWFSN